MNTQPTLPGARFAAGERVVTDKGYTATVIRGEHHCLGDPTTVYVWLAFDPPIGCSGKVYPDRLMHL